MSYFLSCKKNITNPNFSLFLLYKSYQLHMIEKTNLSFLSNKFIGNKIFPEFFYYCSFIEYYCLTINNSFKINFIKFKNITKYLLSDLISLAAQYTSTLVTGKFLAPGLQQVLIFINTCSNRLSRGSRY